MRDDCYRQVEKNQWPWVGSNRVAMKKSCDAMAKCVKEGNLSFDQARNGGLITLATKCRYTANSDYCNTLQSAEKALCNERNECMKKVGTYKVDAKACAKVQKVVANSAVPFFSNISLLITGIFFLSLSNKAFDIEGRV